MTTRVTQKSSPWWAAPNGIEIASIVVFLAAWELLGKMFNPVLFAPPSRVLLSYPDLVASGELGSAIRTTLVAMFVGYVGAAVVGILFGLLWGRSPFIQDVIEPFINALYAIPRVALVPLVIVWFGIGFAGRVFIVFYGTVFDVMINTCTGVRYTEKALLEVGRSFGATERQLFRHIILPYSVPYVMAGLRLGIGRALVGVIVAEMFLQMTGMGGLILTFGETYRIASMLSVVVLLSGLGVLLTWVVKKAERMAAPWKTFNTQS